MKNELHCSEFTVNACVFLNFSPIPKAHGARRPHDRVNAYAVNKLIIYID